MLYFEHCIHCFMRLLPFILFKKKVTVCVYVLVWRSGRTL